MFLAVVSFCLAAFLVLCYLMWDELTRVVGWQRKQHDRISKLEVHEADQDNMIMSHDSRLDRQHAQLKMVKRDLKELGKDVGWADDNTKTRNVEFSSDDEPPDEPA